MLRQLAKRAALMAPGLRGVVMERDGLRWEVGRLVAERDRLEVERELAAARSAERLRAERDPARHVTRSADRGAARAAEAIGPLAPPGHFYSPDSGSHGAPGATQDRLFGQWPRDVPGVALHEAQQIALLETWVPLYAEPTLRGDAEQRHLRHRLQNPFFGFCDTIFLYCMLRHLHPRRVIEVGSGHSSCAILDTAELFLDDRVECTFIEPFPDRLRSLIRPNDLRRHAVVTTRVQDVPVERFASLAADDVLFIDSSHVSKIGSDVNHLFGEVLPSLRPGVYVHVHDVFYPFEYPAEWVFGGRYWTEAYLLRAFLQFNRSFELVLFNHFVQRQHRAWLERRLPLCVEDTGGSIWLRRIG